jgi:hypothetical protein
LAIKGKSKPRARRAVTAGRRPVYVPVHRPLMRRRGFQVGVVVAVAVAAVAAIVYGFVYESRANHRKAAERALTGVSNAFTTAVSPTIQGIGQPRPPDAFTFLPGLKSDIQGLRAGSVKPAQAATDAKAFSKQASDAAAALAKVDPAKLISGKGVEDRVFVRDLINAHFKMQNALSLAAEAADLLGQAAGAKGALADSLLGDANRVFATAETVFSDGYADWVNAQFSAGTFRPTLGTGS